MATRASSSPLAKSGRRPTKLDLPVPPRVVAKVIQMAADPEGNVAELARVIQSDPALCSRVISVANSSLYSPRRPIGSVQHAASFLGIRAVRNIVLCAGVRQLVPARKLAGFPLQIFWEASLRRAAAARCLAVRSALPYAEESFAVSLCQDLGVLVSCLRQPELVADWAEHMAQPAEDRLLAEEGRDENPECHPELGFELLTEWGFPAEFAEPVLYHHRPEEAPAPIRQRARLAWAAEAVADLLLVEDKQAAIRLAEGALESVGLPPATLPEVADEVRDAVSEAAAVFEFQIGLQPSYQEIAAQACAGMFELNLSYEELTRQLQEALVEKERLSEELIRLNVELAERAIRDGLTGLPNRRAFDESLIAELTRAARNGSPLSLVILDVDHFKVFNDTYGHQTGDEVLKLVADCLQSSVRSVDTAARYGGEEFVAILPETGAEGGRKVAERIRRRIAEARFETEGKALSVTVSLGGVTVTGPTGEPGSLVARADVALYKAKRSGRNRVAWAASMGTPSS